MTVIVPRQSSRSKTERDISPTADSLVAAWETLRWIGWIFFVMSMVDLALGWVPVNFGTPEWEFGTFSATFSGLAIPTLSLYLILAASLATDRPPSIKAVGWMMVLLGIALVGVCLVYLTSVPIALKSVATNASVYLGLKKSVFKSLMLFVGYEILYVWGALRGLRPGSARNR